MQKSETVTTILHYKYEQTCTVYNILNPALKALMHRHQTQPQCPGVHIQGKNRLIILTDNEEYYNLHFSYHFCQLATSQ